MLQITGQLSRIKPRLRRYLSFDYFHQKETKPTDKASSRVSLRHLYYFTWKKNELVWLIPVTATVKANLKCCFSRETKIDGKVIK